MTTYKISASGLDDVSVAATALSDVDGAGGHLTIAGAAVEDLAGARTFESVAETLWRLGDGQDGAPARLGQARSQAFAALGGGEAVPPLADAMDAARAALARLEPGTAGGLTLRELATGALPVAAAAWWRRRQGLPPVAPDPSLGHAADYLRMVAGASPPPPLAKALDAYLVTVTDHGMNASTFTARVVASTGADLLGGVVAAICALKGPLHGGAPGPVLDMLDAVESPARAGQYLGAILARGERIMGMGHRIYRVRDPRAAVLERALGELERAGVMTPRLALARAVERAAEQLLREKYPTRELHANVEFYTAVLLDAVGLPRQLFAATFACSRVAGWAAHIAEQGRIGRLIRPQSTYVGPRR